MIKMGKKQFENLRKKYEIEDKKRDKLLSLSREIIKLSKKVIYSTHRKELKEAKKHLKNLEKKVEKIKGSCMYESFVKVAIQEFVEAKLFYEYVRTGELFDLSRLKLGTEELLLGLCDLTGELMRFATNSFINRDFKTVLKIKETMDNIYDELSLFDFRNSELRRKYDSIKYSVKKIDDLVISIQLSKD